jgi:hypothetical protein
MSHEQSDAQCEGVNALFRAICQLKLDDKPLTMETISEQANALKARFDAGGAFANLIAVAHGQSPSADAARALCAMLIDDDKWPCGVVRASELTPEQHADFSTILAFRDEHSPRIEDYATASAISRMKQLIIRTTNKGEASQDQG